MIILTSFFVLFWNTSFFVSKFIDCLSFFVFFIDLFDLLINFYFKFSIVWFFNAIIVFLFLMMFNNLSMQLFVSIIVLLNSFLYVLIIFFIWFLNFWKRFCISIFNAIFCSESFKLNELTFSKFIYVKNTKWKTFSIINFQIFLRNSCANWNIIFLFSVSNSVFFYLDFDLVLLMNGLILCSK